MKAHHKAWLVVFAAGFTTLLMVLVFWGAVCPPAMIPKKSVVPKPQIFASTPPLKVVIYRRPRVWSYVTAAIVTAYAGHDKRCDGRWWKLNRTSTGKIATKTRGIAVAPGVIPYGRSITVPGYGTERADDTGGAMRKDWDMHRTIHLDVRLPTYRQAKKFGRRRMFVRIYGRPPQDPS
ncbi:MAG TPA: 3D domain-containing protein [Candidatus Paceibacterota bacterium]|nr:3D domain-containing protein [Candidatus Paceibacterota bacterium]